MAELKNEPLISRSKKHISRTCRLAPFRTLNFDIVDGIGLIPNELATTRGNLYLQVFARFDLRTYFKSGTYGSD